MKKLLIFISLLASPAFAVVDNVQSCVGNSCKVQVTPRTSAGASNTAITVTGVTAGAPLVGIGTTSPTTPLYVVGTLGETIEQTGATGRLLSFTPPTGSVFGNMLAAGNGVNVGTSSATDLSLQTNGADRVRVLSGGNVGIGNTNPSALLSVGTASALQVDSSGNLTTTGKLRANNAGTVSAPSVQVNASNMGLYQTAADQMGFTVGGAVEMELIGGTGGHGQLNLGDSAIGTAAANSNLAIKASNASMYIQNTGNTGTTTPLGFYRTDTGSPVTVGTIQSDLTNKKLIVGGVNGTDIAGTTTNDNASAGYVGQYVEGVQTTAVSFPGASAQFGDCQNISLGAGDWDISLTIETRVNTAVGLSAEYEYGIGTASGNSATGLTRGVNYFSNLSPTAAANSSVSIPSYRASISTTTLFYGKLKATYSSGNPSYLCRISGRRVR